MICRVFCRWRNEIACEWGHVACWLTTEFIQGLVGKTERKFPFGRPKLRWENDFKMDFQEVGSIIVCKREGVIGQWRKLHSE